MKNGGNYNSRRNFLHQLLTISIASFFLNVFNSCKKISKKILVKITGTNHILGHQLWAKNFPKPTEKINIDYLIIGSGISGLSAARELQKNGKENFLIVEMENNLGGNSNHSQNQYTKFPLAAHYLPLPNKDDIELIQFLTESKIITGYENEEPIFDEEQICSANNERLFIKNYWQNGLIPKRGISQESMKEIDFFILKMQEFSQLKGKDGKYFFEIPICNSSSSDDLNYLDEMTMSEWLNKNNFKSEELINYINYCCRDDYGIGVKEISAMAGIYYFASRKNKYKNYDNTVLTWPEGNGRLVFHLKKNIQLNQVLTNHLAYEIKIVNNDIETKVYNSIEKKSILIKSKYLISAVPQFVNKHLFNNRFNNKISFRYAPWISATITLNKDYTNNENPFAWDNVIYEGKGLGYIFNQHQNIEQIIPNKVITYYHSLNSGNDKKDRKLLFSSTNEYWKEFIIKDLEIAHPDIRNYIDEIIIYKIGHGMISPFPNFIKNIELQKLRDNIENKIYFAHSDLSGISIFEEAFHQGINVTRTILKYETNLD